MYKSFFTLVQLYSKITINAMAKISKDESVPLETLEKICAVLNCKIEYIVEVIPD